MASAAQINANRLNATHSTGPRTDEGKSASRLNAVRHGLTSKHFIIRDDEQEEFAALPIFEEHTRQAPPLSTASGLAPSFWRTSAVAV